MEAVDRQDVSLIKNVEGASQPEAQKPIPLSEDLKRIGVDATHVIGSTFDELMGGEGRDTRDRVASRNPINLVLERAKRIRNRLTQKKAA